MRLRYLEIEHFLSHEHEELTLPESGTFLLSGESGFGKSSLIIDAIGYVLFGPTATRAKQDELRNTEFPGQPMQVRALFEFDDGTQLMLARGVDSHNAAWAQAYEPATTAEGDSLLLASGPHPVGQLIRRRLGGMTWVQFYAAFVARQSQITQLTTLRGAERKTLVHDMLGMREIKRATEQTSRRLRTSRVQLESLTAVVGERTLASEASGITAAQTEAETASQRYEQGKTRLVDMQRRVQNLTESLAPMRAIEIWQTSLREATTELHALAMTIESQRERVRRHQAADQAQTTRNEQQTAANDIQRDLETMRATYARSQRAGKLATERTAMAEILTAARQALPPLELAGTGALNVRLDARLQFLAAEQTRLAQAITKRAADTDRLAESGVCYVCLRPMEGPEHQHVMVVQHEQTAALEAESVAIVQELAHLQAARDTVMQVAEATTRLAQFDEQLTQLRAEGAISEDLVALNHEGQRLNAQASEISQRLGAIEALSRDLDPGASTRLEQTEVEQARLIAQQAELEAQIGDGFDSDDKADRETRLHAAEQLVAEERGRLPELRAAHERAAREATAREREQAALADKLTSLESVRMKVLRLENMQTYLRAFQQKLAREIRPALEEIGSEMLQQISGGRHTSMRIDDNYEIEVETATGSWLRASSLSGGEDVRANLCLRLALTRLVSQRTGVPIRFLVFDEPLPAQDPGHIERIMELLESLRPFYYQIYIISHVGDLENSDHVDYVMQFTAAAGRERVRLVSA